MTPSPVRLLEAHRSGPWTVLPLGASGFCATWRAEGPHGRLFIKSVPAAKADVLAAEADGLEALAATRTVRVPAVAGFWADPAQDQAVLALEWLDFARSSDRDFGARLGNALAALHTRAPGEGAGRFGWRCDNMLGATPQQNRWSERGGIEGWRAFFATERLGAMRARLVHKRTAPQLTAAIDRAIAILPALFDDGHVPRPSLIHGDLWSGNWGCLPDGTPVVFDPAVSVSDAEAELAMMELFGAPPHGFWGAYAGAARLAPGYRRRRALYQLYHLLNHELLFGGYAPRAMATIDELTRGA